MNIYDRSIKLIGENKMKAINDALVFIVGLGGVGGTALLAMARSGFRNFVIMDKDVVDETNLNRQLLYKFNDIGKAKVDAAKANLLEIIPDLEIITINKPFEYNDIENLKRYDFDIMIDAIDDIDAKVSFVKIANEINVPYILSLGMANKLDPSLVKITKLNKTTVDPLARKLRHNLKENNIDISNIDVVFSNEEPITNSNILSSMVMVPSEAGLLICEFAIKTITKNIQ